MTTDETYIDQAALRSQAEAYSMLLGHEFFAGVFHEVKGSLIDAMLARLTAAIATDRGGNKVTTGYENVLQGEQAKAWAEGVATALNHAIRNEDGITLRLEHLDGRPWKNPYVPKPTLIWVVLVGETDASPVSAHTTLEKAKAAVPDGAVWQQPATANGRYQFGHVGDEMYTVYAVSMVSA